MEYDSTDINNGIMKFAEKVCNQKKNLEAGNLDLKEQYSMYSTIHAY